MSEKTPETTSATKPNIIERILAWLRAGYPAGVPREDYVALLGVLHRHLTDAEIEQVIARLAASNATPDDVSSDDVAAEIKRLALVNPSEDDINRVRARLAGGGWPLANVNEAPAAQH